MSHTPTIHTYFDNREGEMTMRESARFFNCEYDPMYRDVRTAFLSEMRSTAKRQEAIDSRLTFLCGCCKRPLKIAGGPTVGKKQFHFMHIYAPGEGECDFYEKTLYSKDEIKAMIFNGRTESRKHREMKASIAQALRNQDNVTEVAVEQVARNVGHSWRKPDIRTEFSDKTVVLEVQLSAIFHHVILERNNAYRNNGWFICWIFEDVNENHPIMRELDAWVNNNYNILGFDKEARLVTERTGKLHLTVKYYEYSVVDDGLNSRLGGNWMTEIIEFDRLTFDRESMMVYLHNSELQKQECIAQIELIKANCRKEIAEAERRVQRQRREQQWEMEEYRRNEEELREVTDYIYTSPKDGLSDEMFRLIRRHLKQLSNEVIDYMLSEIVAAMKSLKLDSLCKWLKITCLVLETHHYGSSTAELLWHDAIGRSLKCSEKLNHLSLNDYRLIYGLDNYHRALTLLKYPIDYATSQFLSTISPHDSNLTNYAPLILLNRYYLANRNIPDRIINFFANHAGTINCLISAQMGVAFGYAPSISLKQIANIVCNSYPSIASLFLHLIERNGFVAKVAETKQTLGKNKVNHYLRLKECATRHPQTTDLTIADLALLLPPLGS